MAPLSNELGNNELPYKELGIQDELTFLSGSYLRGTKRAQKSCEAET